MGTLVCKEGNFTGRFKKGMKNGRGRMVDPEGSMWVGEFLNDELVRKLSESDELLSRDQESSKDSATTTEEEERVRHSYLYSNNELYVDLDLE